MKHNEALTLLPWFANESLSASETRALAKHVRSCEECSAELRESEQFQLAVAEVPASEPAFDPSCLDSTFARLEHVPQLAPLNAEPERTLNLRERASQWWNSQWEQMPSFGKLALAAQLAIVVGLVGVLSQQDADTLGASYDTVAGPSVTTAVGHFTMVFEPQTTEQAMRDLLLEVNAQVVAGPNAMGLYTIRIDTAEQRNAAASKLRASPLVLYIEAVVSP